MAGAAENIDSQASPIVSVELPAPGPGLRLRGDRDLSAVPTWALWLVGDLGARIAALNDEEPVGLGGPGFRLLVGATGGAPPGLATVLDRGEGQLVLLADGLSVRASAASSGGDADLDLLARRALEATLDDATVRQRALLLCRAGPAHRPQPDWLGALAAWPASLRLRLDVVEGVPVQVYLLLSPAPAPGVLDRLELAGVGPADRLALAPLAPRLNLITGDNGLGKSFLLDAAWFCLTGTWAGLQALPEVHGGAPATIRCARVERWGSWSAEARWSAGDQSWKQEGERGAPAHGALVVYALPNNRFAVWDPARSGHTRRDRSGAQRTAPAFYGFSDREVLDGLAVEEGGGVSAKLCLGLIDEWREWQLVGGEAFARLNRVLAALGPDDGRAPVQAGALKRLYLDDARRYPTLRLPHGEEVPILFAPAGYRRMAMLAYLLTWALGEHAEARRAAGLRPTEKVVLLIDEPETHLHPRWQRTVLRGLAAAAQAAAGGAALDVQTFVVTHAPLVLAAAEPTFDPRQDALWKLDLVEGAAGAAAWRVEVVRDDWRRRGDVRAWLTSDVFDLREARSLEAERAIQAAYAALEPEHPLPEALRAATAGLAAHVPADDPLWARWSWACARHGVDV